MRRMTLGIDSAKPRKRDVLGDGIERNFDGHFHLELFRRAIDDVAEESDALFEAQVSASW